MFNDIYRQKEERQERMTQRRPYGSGLINQPRRWYGRCSECGCINSLKRETTLCHKCYRAQHPEEKVKAARQPNKTMSPREREQEEALTQMFRKAVDSTYYTTDYSGRSQTPTDIKRRKLNEHLLALAEVDLR